MTITDADVIRITLPIEIDVLDEPNDVDDFAVSNSLSVPLVGTLRALRQANLDHDKAIAERDSYRLLAQQAIHRLADQQVEIDRIKRHYDHLLDEYRVFRARVIGSEILR
jgi:hypothetical protein